MTHFANSGRLGVRLEQSEATAELPLGTIVTGYCDDTQTEGEYVYVKFNAATAIGQACYIDLTNECVLLDSDVHANDGGPVGWALVAQDADDYGFLQIAGKVKASAGTVSAGGKVFANATAGLVDDAAVNGAQVLGAEFDTADGTPAATFAYITCNRPHVQGQIT
jgi:hypothetical protein